MKTIPAFVSDVQRVIVTAEIGEELDGGLIAQAAIPDASEVLEPESTAATNA